MELWYGNISVLQFWERVVYIRNCITVISSNSGNWSNISIFFYFGGFGELEAGLITEDILIRCAPYKHNIYSRTSIARTSLGPWTFVRGMGSSKHWELIMVPDQRANSDNIEIMLSVFIRIASMRWIQWVHITYNFMIKYKKFSRYLFFWSCR